MILPIAEVEDILVERIRTALPYVENVGRYQGELEGDPQALAAGLPAVWVDFRGTGAPRALDTAGRCWRTELELSTVAAAATRLDQNGAAGSYRLLDGAQKALAACEPDLPGVARPRPGRIVPRVPTADGAGQAASVSVWVQDWTVACEYALPDQEDAVPLRAVSLDYRLSSGPDVPAAQDELSLPGA